MKSLAYYCGLQYKINVENKNGIFEAWIDELGREVNGTGTSKEEAIRNCCDAKIEFIKMLISKNISIPEPETKYSTKLECEEDLKKVTTPIETQELKIIELLNSIFDIKNIHYNEFNSIILFDDNKADMLKKIKNQNSDLVIFEKDEKIGISTLSMIATITKILYKKTLAFNIDGDIIKGIKFLES